MSRIVPSRVSNVACVAVVVVAAALNPVVRLIATAGNLDPSFGINGIATATSTGSDALTRVVAIQPDGRILAAASEANRIVIVRFDPDGAMDPTFGVNGVVKTNAGFDEIPMAILVRPDGRIAVVGNSNQFPLNAQQAVIVQYNADGSLDPTFGVGGITFHDVSVSFDDVKDAVLQPDGKIVVAGFAFVTQGTHNDFVVRRFNTDGSLDASFGTGGISMTNIYGVDEAFGVALQPDGRIVLAGFSDTAPGQPRHMAFVRYLPDGVPDPSFGVGGVATVDPAPGLSLQTWAHEVLIQPDGRIVGAGFTEYLDPDRKDATIVRLLPDGQPDSSFAGDGSAQFPEGRSFGGRTGFGGFGSIAQQPDGRLVGTAASDRVMRVNSDGSLDTTFHGDGVVSVPGPIYDIAVQADGKAIVGSSPVPGTPGLRVVRLLSENAPPALTPAAISVERGTSPRLTIGTASDASDPLTTLAVAPVAATLPAGLTFNGFLVNATTGAVSAVVSPSCTTATGTFDVQFSITDGSATTFATVPVEVREGAPPTLSLADKTVDEGDASAVPAQLVLTANGPVCAPVTVTYATADGTAVAPGDYIATSGTATIAIGQPSTTIPVAVVGERVAENDETFFVTLGAPVNASIADGQAVVTIRDDEPSVVQFAAITAVDVLETDTRLPAQIVTLRVARVTGLSTLAIASISVSGTASFLSDYDFPDEPFVTFNPGQTEAELRVTILADLVEEATETVTISLNEWVNASIGSPSTALITIRDNDGAPSDPDKPIIVGSVPSPNAAGWHKADLSVALSASDGTGSGVKSISYALSGAQASVLTVVPAATVSIPIVIDGITTVTFFAEDVAGNVAASQSLTVRLDKTAPGVVITSPQARVYTLNEAAAAAYSCTDGVSGIASCTGTTAVGGAIDTASAGSKTFNATATDLAGNVATSMVAYSVVVPPPTFTIRALYDPLKEHTRNSAIPIKLQVENAAGVNVSSAGLVVEALAVSSGTEIGPAAEALLADDAGQSNPLGRFRFVSDGAYLFNLKTAGLTAGPYVLVVRIAGDTALHAVPFLIREP